jgi:hypothetical protein
LIFQQSIFLALWTGSFRSLILIGFPSSSLAHC